MSHVDYLCPICNSRAGTARVGAYADPLDPIKCLTCGAKLRFHDLLPRREDRLLRGQAPRPQPLTFLGVVADTSGTTTVTTRVFGTTQSLMLVMASGNINGLTWGSQAGNIISPESDAGINFYLFIGPGSFPLIFQQDPGSELVAIVAEIANGESDTFQGPDNGPRNSVGSTKEVTVQATSHDRNSLMVGAQVNSANFPLIFSDPPFILGPVATNPSQLLSSFYGMVEFPATTQAEVYMQGGSPWSTGMTVFHLI